MARSPRLTLRDRTRPSRASEKTSSPSSASPTPRRRGRPPKRPLPRHRVTHGAEDEEDKGEEEEEDDNDDDEEAENTDPDVEDESEEASEQEDEEEDDDADEEEEDDDEDDEDDSADDDNANDDDDAAAAADDDDSNDARPPRATRRSNPSHSATNRAPSARSQSKRLRATSADPFVIGADVSCKWSGDDAEHEARILQVRKTEAGLSEYYVRYLGFDHRLDEWVAASRLRAVQSHHHQQDSPKQTRAMPVVTRTQSPRLGSEAEDEAHQVKNIHTIMLGKYEIDTWYYSPYPDEYCQEGKLFICEFCLKYLKKKHTLERHAEKCEARHPPGEEVYRDGELSVFEVDGKKHRIYCQNLCLLSKLFLDHKTLYYDVDPFFFYILTECDSKGAHICGYFSKEKVSPDNYNLACILTLPPYQRKGYGSFLISLSYELSKREGVCGSPEKPLSDLGRLGYHSYWSRVVLDLLRKKKGTELSIRDMSRMTAITPADIIETLRALNLVRFWKGSHVLAVSQKLVDGFLDSLASKRFRVINPAKLSWVPKKTQRDAVATQF